MHLKLFIPFLLVLSAPAALGQNAAKVNVVLEKSCWTSAACREAFKNRFHGRVSTVQMRVPWELMYPAFNHSLIRSSAQHLQTVDSAATIEPLYIFKNQAELDHLQKFAHDLSVSNLPRGAFLLDSTDAKENLAVITRELSIIHTVFRGRHNGNSNNIPGKFYNIPPRSFLSTKHLHKYLSFVRKHVTAVRLQLNKVADEAMSGGTETVMPLATLDDMLTVISNSSLVPEVEVAWNNSEHQEILQQLSRHHITVYESISSQDLQDSSSSPPSLRPRRSPVESFNYESHEEDNAGVKSRQGQLGKLFPSLGLKTPAMTWSERRLNAKRNLEKLFDKLATTKVTVQKSGDSSKLPEMTKTKGTTSSMDKSTALNEDAIFRESDNPHFPKEDVTVALIDRRGDVNAKDYDYVEFGGGDGKQKKDVFGELSEEEGEETVDFEEPRRDRIASSSTKKPVSAAAKDLELGEIENYPQKTSRRSQHHHSSQHAEDDEESRFYLTPDQLSAFGIGGGDYQVEQPSHFYADDEEGGYGAVNYTTDSYYHPETEQQKSRHRSNRRRTRSRRDIFSQSGGAQSLFEDIRDYYPTMLRRLDELLLDRPKRQPEEESPLNVIENLLSVGNPNPESRRKVRSSGFIRHDPATNEIGYMPRAVTLAPLLELVPSKSSSSSFVEVFLDRWHAFQHQLRKLLI